MCIQYRLGLLCAGSLHIPRFSGQGSVASVSHVWACVSQLGMGRWMKQHSRAIYGCTFAPDGLQAPADCRYTYNPEANRLYLHCFAWPFKSVHLPGLAGRVQYAQLLNDASEIHFRDQNVAVHEALNAKTPTSALTLELPVLKPNVDVPVVELMLK